MPANFEPGEDYKYANTNYLLLDKIMERVLVYSYDINNNEKAVTETLVIKKLIAGSFMKPLS